MCNIKASYQQSKESQQMKKIALASLLLVSGCIGLHDEPIYFKDNHQVYRAVCNGLARDIGDCYALASKRCGGEFEILEREDEDLGTYNQSSKSSDYTRQGTRRSYDNGDFVDSVTDYKGRVNSSSSGMKLKMINRSLYFYCK